MPTPSQTQSHLRHPLTTLLGSPGQVRVLRALAHDRAPQSAPQLAAAAGLTPQGTRGVLDVLARQRLVKAHGSGRTLLYELNAAHPLAASLAALFHDEQARWDSLMNSIRDVLAHHAAVSAAWLLGRKDEVIYGARSTTLEEAQRLLAELDEFAAWAEGPA